MHGIQESEIKQLTHTAIGEYGGMCASVALAVVGQVFGVFADEILLATGVGLRFDGALGGALSAHAGVCQFIANVAHAKHLDRQKTLHFCRLWQKAYEAQISVLEPGVADEETLAAGVIGIACDFLQTVSHDLGLEENAPPKQYYDSIYADRESMFKHSPYALEEKLSKAVTKGDGEAALAALRAITAQGEKAVLAKDPLRSVKNSIIGSIAFLARAAIQAGVSANDAFALSDALTQRVEEMATREAVLAFEESILLQFISLVRQRLEAAYTAPIVKVMHYVENHLDAKIPLADAAAYAGVHPAYLSARFKQETGLAFTAYVTLRKVQESSYFVRHTGYSVSQIASLYGFSSQSWYITCFKKVMGTTPMQYRRQLLAE